MAIDYAQLQALMADFTYKPDFEFELFDETRLKNGRPGLIIHFRMPDVTGRGIKTWGAFYVPERLAPNNSFWDWMRDVVIDYLENHEADEWFRIRGEPYRWPHNPTRPFTKPEGMV